MELKTNSSSQSLTPATVVAKDGCAKRKFVFGGIVGFVLGAVIFGVAVGVPLSQRSSGDQPVLGPNGSVVEPGTDLYRAIQVLGKYPLVDGYVILII